MTDTIYSAATGMPPILFNIGVYIEDTVIGVYMATPQVMKAVDVLNPPDILHLWR